MRGVSGNRSREKIVASILTAIASAPSVRKTLIMYQAALSFSQLQIYLPYAEQLGLIRMTDDREWTITARGRQYLEAYDTMQQLMELGSQHALLVA